MENWNVCIDTGNVNKNWRRTSSDVEGWSCRLNSVTGKQQSGVFLQARRLKVEAEIVSWQLEWKETESMIERE
jgi:hypothetical protein